MLAGKVPGEACPCSGPAVPGSVAPGEPGDAGPCCFCRRPAGGQALPEVQGDGQEVRVRGLRLLQLQRPPVVSVRVLLQDGARRRAAERLGWGPLPQHTGLTERSPGLGLQSGQATGVRGTSQMRRACPASCKPLRCGQRPAGPRVRRGVLREAALSPRGRRPSRGRGRPLRTGTCRLGTWGSVFRNR